MPDQPSFKPFVSADTQMKEFTLKSILMGAIFGVIFGAATVYLALKAGLTVSASISYRCIINSAGKIIFENNYTRE